jgi:hypothetical protein
LAAHDQAPPKPSQRDNFRKVEEMSIDNPAPRPRLSGFGLADWLCLAAAPTFAAMALVTAAYSGNDVMCMSGASLLGGMVPMYLLMAAFHLAPWIRLVARPGDI